MTTNEDVTSGFEEIEFPRPSGQPRGNGADEPNRPGTPADGGQHEWPTMDDAAYYGFAGDFVRTVGPHSEADPNGLLVQTLTGAGNVMGHMRHYRVERDRHFTNLCSAMVGQSAKGRKGVGLNWVLDIIKYAYETWADDHIRSGLSSGEGLIEAVRDPIEKMRNGEVEVVDAGVRDKRLLVIEPEFASVLAVTERPGNTLSSVFRKAWDGGVLATMTRNSPLKATNPHISMIAHTTQDELRSRLTRNDMANGFANRILFVLVKRSKLLPFGGNLPDSEFVRLAETFKRSIEHATDLWDLNIPAELTMTQAAREEWVRAYPELSAPQPGLFGAITARAEAQVIRLALIYALLDRSTQIDLPHLKAGLAVWDYCNTSASLIFGDSLGDETADTILRALRSAGPTGLTRTLIYNLFSNKRASRRIDIALDLLLKHRRVRFDTQTTGGRPSEWWFAV